MNLPEVGATFEVAAVTGGDGKSFEAVEAEIGDMEAAAETGVTEVTEAGVTFEVVVSEANVASTATRRRA